MFLPAMPSSIVCTCGNAMQMEFVPASKQGRDATVLLACRLNRCPNSHKRFKLAVPMVYVEEVAAAPVGATDLVDDLTRMIKP